MKDLTGNNIPQKVKKEKGVSKTICFAKIICPDQEQLGVFENDKLNLEVVLEQAFNLSNDNYNQKDKCFILNFNNDNYAIRLIEKGDDYYFGQISTEKEFNDVLEEYKNKENNENIKSIIIKYFTFFYIDVKKKSIVYIGQKGIKSIRTIFQKYLSDYGKGSIIVQYLGDKDLLNQIKKSNKLTSINFQLADNDDVRKSLDRVLAWDRNINDYSIQIKIRKPAENLIGQILSDPNRHIKIKKPVLTFQDEAFNEYVTHLFEDYFTVKSVIYSSEIDFGKYENIKNKLIISIKEYVG